MASKGKPDFFREMDQELKSKSWEKVVNHIYNFWTLAINKMNFIGELHDTILQTDCYQNTIQMDQFVLAYGKLLKIKSEKMDPIKTVHKLAESIITTNDLLFLNKDLRRLLNDTVWQWISTLQCCTNTTVCGPNCICPATKMDAVLKSIKLTFSTFMTTENNDILVANRFGGIFFGKIKSILEEADNYVPSYTQLVINCRETVEKFLLERSVPFSLHFNGQSIMLVVNNTNDRLDISHLQTFLE